MVDVILPTKRRLAAPPILTGATSARCDRCNDLGWTYVAQRLRRFRRGMEAEILETRYLPPEIAPMAQLDYLLGHAYDPESLEDRKAANAWHVASVECDCRSRTEAERRRVRILGESAIPQDVELFSFESFMLHRDIYGEAVAYARAFVDQDSLLDETGVERTGLYFAGAPGSGKSTLGSLVFLERLKRQPGVWIKYPDLEAKVRWTYAPDYSGPSKYEIQDRLMRTAFLMLDELGSVTRGEKAYAEDMSSFMYTVFDHRWAKRLPTIITTNLSEQELVAQFGEPCMSRIFGLCHIVLINGPDWRR